MTAGLSDKGEAFSVKILPLLLMPSMLKIPGMNNYLDKAKKLYETVYNLYKNPNGNSRCKQGKVFMNSLKMEHVSLCF